MPSSRFRNYVARSPLRYAPPNVGKPNVHETQRWGVSNATQEFAREVGAPLHITFLNDCYLWPAWYMVKP